MVFGVGDRNNAANVKLFVCNEKAKRRSLKIASNRKHVKYVTMGLGGGPRPPSILKISAKKGCFLSSVGKTNCSIFGTPLEKFLKNPSDAHVRYPRPPDKRGYLKPGKIARLLDFL